MENKSQIKTCQNCKNSFTIEPDDFGFYEKINVPPPTFCPECRMVRRMAWRNERSLFKRKCGKTGKEIITMFHPDVNVVIYDRDEWWGEDWNPFDYGIAYDFTRPFFEQFKELLSKVPLQSLGNTHVINSPYVNHSADSRDCYLTYGSWKNERVYYSEGMVDTKDCFDMYITGNAEKCYGGLMCTGVYKTHFSYNAEESINSWFLEHCINMQDSIGSVNLRNKRYCVYNEQYSKEDYMEKIKEFDFGSWNFLKKFEKEYREFSLKFPRKYANNIKCVNSTGDNLMGCKNTKYAFDVYNDTEDSKFVAHTVTLKDGYDGYGVGAGSSLMYEGVDSGLKSGNQLFAVLAHSNFNTNYVYMCYNSNNLFGCIGLRKKDYCILNKQYDKYEYEIMVEKIKQHMNDMPYIDKNGRIYKYGEFFPIEFSPFGYNETITQEFFPKTETEIKNIGGLYREHYDRHYVPTIKSEDLPDHIRDVDDTILNEIISCPNNGDELTQCTNAYKIIKEELEFLRNHSIALPRHCPNCRHHQRVAKRNPMKLWHRACMKEGCENVFETSYAPERPEIIYCEKCYQQEVV